ncbi:3317_t:CDS:1, partial [Ambispora gerdemannii]
DTLGLENTLSRIISYDLQNNYKESDQINGKGSTNNRPMKRSVKNESLRTNHLHSDLPHERPHHSHIVPSGGDYSA